jgi:hypothetical protein
LRNSIQSSQGRFAIFLCGASFGISIVSCLVAGCADDTGNGRRVDLGNSWPNDDGRYWVYEYHGSLWSDSLNASTYPNRGDVPPAPSLDEAVTLFQQPLEGTPLSTSEGTYRLQFHGMTTTGSGAVGQNLQSWLDEVPVAATNAGNRTDSRGGDAEESGFLAQLRRARPDLAEKALGPAILMVPLAPTFLFGGAFEKSDAYTGLYGDLDLDLAWKYLEENLDIGHEFTLQLVPSLANDVYLRARVHEKRFIDSGMGAPFHALEVIYMIDFGILEILDLGGNHIGYSRAFSVGNVVYIADVGPVWSEERNLYFVGATPTGPIESLTLDLQETGKPPIVVPAGSTRVPFDPDGR